MRGMIWCNRHQICQVAAPHVSVLQSPVGSSTHYLDREHMHMRPSQVTLPVQRTQITNKEKDRRPQRALNLRAVLEQTEPLCSRICS